MEDSVVNMNEHASPYDAPDRSPAPIRTHGPEGATEELTCPRVFLTASAVLSDAKMVIAQHEGWKGEQEPRSLSHRSLSLVRGRRLVEWGVVAMVTSAVLQSFWELGWLFWTLGPGSVLYAVMAAITVIAAGRGIIQVFTWILSLHVFLGRTTNHMFLADAQDIVNEPRSRLVEAAQTAIDEYNAEALGVVNLSGKALTDWHKERANKRDALQVFVNEVSEALRREGRLGNKPLISEEAQGKLQKGILGIGRRRRRAEIEAARQLRADEETDELLKDIKS